MPRERNDDIEFGSDSFLDVVANIVGILIILIVVAGIKAGATPVNVERVADYLKKHAAPKASETTKSVGPPRPRPSSRNVPIRSRPSSFRSLPSSCDKP